MNLSRKVSNALVARGYRRYDRNHLFRVDQDWSFCVDTGPLGKQSDIHPFVGIRHDGVETILAELMALPAYDWTGTVGANVGYILGFGYIWWKPPSQPEEVLRAIDHAIERLRPFLNLERLPELWNTPGTKEPAWRFKEMVILLLLGKREALFERLDAARAVECKNEDEICEQFRSFEQRILVRLKILKD